MSKSFSVLLCNVYLNETDEFLGWRVVIACKDIFYQIYDIKHFEFIKLSILGLSYVNYNFRATKNMFIICYMHSIGVSCLNTLPLHVYQKQYFPVKSKISTKLGYYFF